MFLLYIILIPLAFIFLAMVISAFNSYSNKEKEREAIKTYDKFEDMGGKYIDGIGKVVKILIILIAIFVVYLINAK